MESYSDCNYKKITDNSLEFDNDDDDDHDHDELMIKLEEARDISSSSHCDDDGNSCCNTTTSDNTTWSPNKNEKKKLSRCAIIAHVVLCVLVSFLLSLTVLVSYEAAWMKRQVIRFTSAKPGNALIPIHPMPSAQVQVVKDRIKLFADMILANQIIPEHHHDLVLTQDEINGLIAHNDYLRGNVFVRIKKSDNDDSHDTLFVDMSLPVRLSDNKKEDRYFVAAGFLDVAVVNNNKNNTTAAAAALVTAHLDTKYKVPDVDQAIWHSETSLYWENDNGNEEEASSLPQQQHHRKLVLNVERGNFLNWIVPQDFVNEHRNLMDYILYNNGNADDDGYDNDNNDYGCERMRKIIKAIESVTLQDGRIVIHASPFMIGDHHHDQNDDDDIFKHHWVQALKRPRYEALNFLRKAERPRHQHIESLWNFVHASNR